MGPHLRGLGVLESAPTVVRGLVLGSGLSVCPQHLNTVGMDVCPQNLVLKLQDGAWGWGLHLTESRDSGRWGHGLVQGGDMGTSTGCGRVRALPSQRGRLSHAVVRDARFSGTHAGLPPLPVSLQGRCQAVARAAAPL